MHILKSIAGFVILVFLLAAITRLAFQVASITPAAYLFVFLLTMQVHDAYTHLKLKEKIEMAIAQNAQVQSKLVELEAALTNVNQDITALSADIAALKESLGGAVTADTSAQLDALIARAQAIAARVPNAPPVTPPVTPA